jgi:hypothetical protein
MKMCHTHDGYRVLDIKKLVTGIIDKKFIEQYVKPVINAKNIDLLHCKFHYGVMDFQSEVLAQANHKL